MSRASARLARLKRKLAALDNVIIVTARGPFAGPDAPEWRRPTEKQRDYHGAGAWHLLAVIASSPEAEARAVADLRRRRPEVVIPNALTFDGVRAGQDSAPYVERKKSTRTRASRTTRGGSDLD